MAGTVSIIDMLQLAGLLGGGGWALLTYRREARLRRAEWIYRLFEKFYESEKFKPIRRILDYEPKDEIDQLRIDAQENIGSDAHEALVDYLNFFEFIAIQIRKGQLGYDEVRDMFDYYIRRLGDHDFIVAYLDKNGFEDLSALVRRMRRK